MKGYERIHVIAVCRECEWRCGDFNTAQEEARKHHEKTGHAVDVEVGYWKEYPHEDR